MLHFADILGEPLKRFAMLRHRGAAHRLSATRRRSYVTAVVLFFMLMLLTMPLFFDIYRLAAFNTSPRDDYAPQLLALAGERGEPPLRQQNLLAGAPFGYRILSVAVGLPFYYLVPLYEFTNSTVADADYLRATQALALVSYLSIVLTALFTFMIAYQRFQSSFLSSAVVSALSIALSGFLSRTGVDPLAVLVLSMLIYFMRTPTVFYGLMLLSALINEKILIIIGSLLLGRVALSLWSYRPWFRMNPRDSFIALGSWSRSNLRTIALCLSLLLSLLIYLLMRAIFQLGGDAHRADVSLWLPKALSTLSDTLSLKGAVTNLAPIGVLFVIVMLALREWRLGRDTQPYFQPSDIVCFFVLIVVALIINSKFTAGRLVMHCFPIYLPLIARFIDAQFGAFAEARAQR